MPVVALFWVEDVPKLPMGTAADEEEEEEEAVTSPSLVRWWLREEGAAMMRVCVGSDLVGVKMTRLLPSAV